MYPREIQRRDFLKRALASTAVAASGSLGIKAIAAPPTKADDSQPPGNQRLGPRQLRKWESLQYGMFIHFGIATFVRKENPDGQAPPSTYAPDRLDVDQWVSVARDAGMKYAVLTTKNGAGHCLWPSKHTDYTVANSPDKTDVVEAFCRACEKRGVLPGLYYASSDNHHRFGSRTRLDVTGRWDQTRPFPKSQENLPPYTTSLYQDFQTAQMTELLTQYGPIAETWIDIPGEMGRGYRTFLYQHMASLQPQTVIMMNSGTPDANQYNVTYAWPSDLVAMERGIPSGDGPPKWRVIEGKRYYMPVEVCDPIGKEWFWVPGDMPRSDEVLLKQLNACRAHNVNLLLDVPPDAHGVIPKEFVAALMRLRKNTGI